MDNKYPEVELLKDIFDMQDMAPVNYNQMCIFFKEVKTKDTLANFVWQLLDETHFMTIASLYGLIDRIPKSIQKVADIYRQTAENTERIHRESLDVLRKIQNKELLKQNVLQEQSDQFPILCPDCNKDTLLLTGKIQEPPKDEAPAESKKTVIEFSFQRDGRSCSRPFSSLRYCPYCRKIVSDADFYKETQSLATICSKYFQ